MTSKHKQINPHTKVFGVGAGTPLKRKVFVGLSGGVDSSVSAALLKKAGYDVTGVFIKVWQPDFFEPARLNSRSGGCTWKDDRLDAMRVCAKLNIPFMELNLEKEYKREVVDYMILEYKLGRTPNPDVMCNRFIKFGAFYKWAIAHEADFIATGHYARIRSVKDKRLRIKDFGLFAGSDPRKDQSYFLWQIRKEQLPHILFPVGGLQKLEVRRLAKKFGLVTAEKKDSQGLCFVGKIDMKDFLRRYIKERRGKVIDEQGKVIGTHNGAILYTQGERISLATTAPSGGVFKGGWYVVAKDMERNTLTVSQKSPEGNLGGGVTEIGIKNCNWLLKPARRKTYLARLRYRQPLQPCVLEAHGTKVRFMSPQTVAPGQSLVLYDGDLVMGGGIIK